MKGGTGSGDVNVRKTVSIARGLEEAGFEIVTEDWLDRYDRDLEEAQKTYLKKLKDMSDETGEPSVILGSNIRFRNRSNPIVEETDIKRRQMLPFMCLQEIPEREKTGGQKKEIII